MAPTTAIVQRKPDAALERTSDTTAIITMIERVALNPNADIDKMERLMAMHERITIRNKEQAFAEAMTACQAEMRPVATDANNPQTKSRYASYFALDKVLRPVYSQHGFSPSFDTADGAPELHVRVVCFLSHRDGHTRMYHIDMPADGKGAKGGDVMTRTHATGSAVTYGMRYLLKMIFNIAIGDDDGNQATATGELLSPKQIEMVRDMIRESGANEVKFCAYMKVASVNDLAASQFESAMAALRKYDTKRRAR
jgi:hypothetical protein